MSAATSTFPPVSNDLLLHARREIARQGFAPTTQKAYLQWSRRFVRFHSERQLSMTRDDALGDFLRHLETEQAVASSTRHQASCALRWFARVVLERPRVE